MANVPSRYLTFALLLVFCFALPAHSMRSFEQRRDLTNVPPISASNWSVPLQGGNTCNSDGSCSNSLQPPPSDMTLQVLALGHGAFNYTCEDVESDGVPVYVNQYTELYNAAPLVNSLPSEQSFHDLVPAICEFDYGELHNSTLECLGTVGTLDGTAVITLYDIATFEADLEQIVDSPDDPQVNGVWARSTSLDGSWEMYRVEMAGGAIPNTCEGFNTTFNVTYAAEYWFYHA